MSISHIFHVLFLLTLCKEKAHITYQNVISLGMKRNNPHRMLLARLLLREFHKHDAYEDPYYLTYSTDDADKDAEGC